METISVRVTIIGIILTSIVLITNVIYKKCYDLFHVRLKLIL